MKGLFTFIFIFLLTNSTSLAECHPEDRIEGSYLIRLKDSSDDIYSSYSAKQLKEELVENGIFVKTIHNQRLKRANVLSADKAYKIPNTLLHINSFNISKSELEKDPRVESVQYDCWMKTTALPNDSNFNEMWGLEIIQMEQAWDISTGSSDIIVSISDTGIDYEHPDLAANMWTNTAELNGRDNFDDDGNGCIDDIYGCDTANNDGDPMPSPENGEHGTHVAGTVGAVGNNARGVVGINWNIKLMAAKGFPDGQGNASLSALLDSVYYSANNGARVINCSWGGRGSPDQASRDAFQYAIDQGVVPVVAAGNDTMNANAFSPAGISFVLTVGATNTADELATFSNYGSIIDIVAPGGDIRRNGIGRNDVILSTFPNNRYAGIQGTSMAAPHIAGLAGLILSINPNLSVQEVMDIIVDNGDMIDVHASNPSRTSYRYPRMNALKAAQVAQSTLPQPTPPPIVDDSPNLCTSENCAQRTIAQLKPADMASGFGCGFATKSDQAKALNPFFLLLFLAQPLLLVIGFKIK